MNQLRHLVIPLLASLLSSTLLAQAPDTLWTKTIGYHENGYFNSVEQTTDDGFILGGHTSSDDSSCYRLMRLDSDGNILLDKVFRAVEKYEDQRAIQTADGGFAIAGDGDPWLIRTDDIGTKLWDQAISTLGNGISISWIEETADQGFIATGTYEHPVNNLDVLVVKTDIDGDTVWVKTYGDVFDDDGLRIKPTSDGGYAVAGYSAPEDGGIRDGWLLKLSATGDSLWSVRYGGTAEASFRAIQETADNGFILVGKITAAGDTTSDIYLVKTDADGAAEWTKIFGGANDDEGVAVIQTSDLGFTFVAMGAVEPAGDVGGWVVHTAANGDTLWTLLVGDPNYNFGLDLVELGENEYLLAGGRIDWGLMEAYGWVARLGTGPTPLELDSLALVALFNSTGGDNWMNPWDLNTPVDTWSGVTVSGGRVTEIYMNGYGLSGTIPPSLGNLTALTDLNLSYNQLTGILPDTLSNLTQLADFRIAVNELTGTIPAWLCEMNSLTYLSLTDNLLTGTIPENIGNLTNLIGLELGINGLTGTIPMGIGDLVNLESLSLNGNMLSGTIPDVFANLTSLISLSLNDNQLEGPIPASFGSLSSIRDLILHNNRLSGELPIALADLVTVSILWLHNNLFTGAVPESFANLTACNQLLLGGNQLTSLPDLSGLWLLSLYALFVENNRLTFEDIEPNMPHPDSLNHTFAYFPQDSVGTERDTTIIVGSNLSLAVAVGGTANQYQWKKDGVNIALANDDTLIIPVAGFGDTGDYTLEISNTIADELILYSWPTHVTVIVDPFEADSLALVALYDSTGGANWTKNTGWLVPDSTLDTWFGVTVVDGRVSDVRLSNNNLVGSIPPAIGDLTALEDFYLGDNQLTGTIPGEIGNLAALETLYLKDNQLTGTIPVQIGDLASIISLHLSGNQLSGEIPAVIGDLDNLITLMLYENNLTGVIPPSIGNLTAMTSLSLGSNELSGEIPTAIGNLVNLVGLSMGSNQLTGSIPSEIVNFPELIDLYLQDNQLTGPIPASIGTHPKLRNLHLAVNELNGTIPPEIGNDTSLAYVNLGNNQLSGPIPPDIGELVNLTHLVLTGNQLTALPSTIDSLINLTYLQLGDNQLTSIPPDIGGLVNLTELDLCENQLARLPAEIGHLPSLTTLSFSFNLLDSLPDLSGDTSLTMLILDHNRLTFEDIEPLIGLSIPTLYYAMQDSVGAAMDTTVDLGSELVFSVDVGGTANKYLWYKNAAGLAGDTSATYTISSMSYQDTGTYICQITNTIATDLYLYNQPIHVSISVPAAVSGLTGIPEEFALHANYPNPFNPSTTLRYDLPEAVEVTLLVYDLLGREVVRLVDGHREAGYHRAVWNGRDRRGREVPTGLYIARIFTPEYTRSIKLVLLK